MSPNGSRVPVRANRKDAASVSLGSVESRTIYPSLNGKAVFVTGGASGIGAGLVSAFASQGCKVAFADLDEPSARALCRRVANETGIVPWFRHGNLADPATTEAAIVDAHAALDGLDILINNVANDRRHTVEETDATAWRDCLAINLDAAYVAFRAALPFIRSNGGGAVVNLSSINALLGPPGMPGYVTAKAGIIGLTKALAREFGADRVKVNAVLPGWVVTEKQLEKWLTPEAESEWCKSVALKDRLQVEDIANLSLFLASEDSRMITGQSFVIDAGRT